MMTILVWAVPTMFFVLLIVSGAYVHKRLGILFGAATGWPTKLAIMVAVVTAPILVDATATSANPIAGAIYEAAGYVLTFYIYLFIALLVQQVLQPLWRLSPMYSGLAAVFAPVAFTVYGAINASNFTVRNNSIYLLGLQEPLKVMLISDVHIGNHRGANYLRKIVQATNSQAPDLVLITGDLLDSESALMPGVLDPLADIAAPAYYVIGNHEIAVDAARSKAIVASFGIKVLNNERVLTHGIELVGLDYMKADEHTFDLHPSSDTRTIQSTMASMSLATDRPTVVMHHSPVGIPYFKVAGADLLLAGHTHAGQLFPATLITAAIFRFNQGRYEDANTQVFVSTGAGTFMQKARIGTSNEINLITLLPRESER